MLMGPRGKQFCDFVKGQMAVAPGYLPLRRNSDTDEPVTMAVLSFCRFEV